MLFTPLARGEWRDEVGYTRLIQLAGAELPIFPVNGVSMIEGPAEDPVGTFVNYLPDLADPMFAGISFTIKSGTTATSMHAQFVASPFFGANSSLLSGVGAVDCYEVNHWASSGFLNHGTSTAPLVESRAVQNHSWIGNGLPTGDVEQINRRLDHAIHRDGFTCAVGVNNTASPTSPGSTTLPQLLSQSYNTISVGVTSGNHSAGFTTLDGTGRIKPDIVAPTIATSFATPMVAGAAALLHQKLSTAPYALAGPDLPRVTKALLLATASRTTVPGWANTSTRPLDLRYGAGELNVNHAYNALKGGRHADSTVAEVPERGWDYETIAVGAAKFYYFTIPAGAPSTPFGAALTWHRIVTDGNPSPAWGNLVTSLADLDLYLYHASGLAVGSQIAASEGFADNVELVAQAALAPGSYALKVENNGSTSADYGLAWHSLPAVTIAAPTSIAREIDGQPGVIVLTRTGDTSLPLLVPLTVSGTAVSGSHYFPVPSSVQIPAGQSSFTLAISPIPDFLPQGNRTVTVALSTDFASVRQASPVVTVTIEDKPFDQWRFNEFTTLELADPLVSGTSADPDADGLANLVEYGTGLDPQVSDVSPVGFTEAAGVLTLSVTKSPAATDVTWQAEVSSDLETWSPATTTTDTSTNFSAFDGAPPVAPGVRFIRLKLGRL